MGSACLVAYGFSRIKCWFVLIFHDFIMSREKEKKDTVFFCVGGTRIGWPIGNSGEASYGEDWVESYGHGLPRVHLGLGFGVRRELGFVEAPLPP